MKIPKRTSYCGELRLEDENKKVVLAGWVFAKRVYKKLVFVDLRDRTGLVQLVFTAKNVELSKIKEVNLESVISVEGIVVKRKEENPDLKTGKIEVKVENYEILTTAEEKLPFALHGYIEVAEDLRLKYRYLDLRRPEILQHAIKTRHQVYKAIWEIMDDLGFLYVETPNLIKSTPEGARDYLVPSRIKPGNFYALPQSPQILKQLLMVSGVDKYFQIAKCFRDEDLRADRQPEFTQLDIELSFVEKEDVMDISEQIMVYLMKKTKGIKVKTPFEKMTYEDVMNKFGSDKPDLRWKGRFETIRYKNQYWKAIYCEQAEKDVIEKTAIEAGFSPENFVIVSRTQLKSLKLQGNGKYALLYKLNNEKDYCSPECELFRRNLMKKLNLVKEDQYEFLWVHNFPLFEYSEEEERLVSVHHPFTSPNFEDLELLESDPLKARSASYDLVLNGYEIGGGSIRIHDQQLQEKIFDLLKISKEDQEARFGFLLKAFKYGPPPHGGIAFGLDRVIMLLSGGNSLRDVITFPKNKDGEDPLTGAPSPVDKEQLDVLGIQLKR